MGSNKNLLRKISFVIYLVEEDAAEHRTASKSGQNSVTSPFPNQIKWIFFYSDFRIYC